jgi:deoxyribose-phosphate aldolase
MQNISTYIDHTLLKPEALKEDIEKLCKEAIKYNFHCVCIHPKWIKTAAEMLEGKLPCVCSVAGFPYGTNMTKIKAIEAKEAIIAGAGEIDIVSDISAIISKDERSVVNDIYAVSKVCKSFSPKVLLKVIIESALLTDEQIVFACKCCNKAGADFIKTSTGFHSAGGASIEAVKIIKENAGYCKVKAAGGIRTLEQAISMIQAGADRIGCSASVSIIEEADKRQSTNENLP